MFIFMCILTFICVFNLLVMGYIVYLYIIEVLFNKDTETTKDMPLERPQ